MNSNKRVGSVIAAIGSDALLRQRVDYSLIGVITPAEAAAVRSQASAELVEVAVVGEASTADLASLLANSHAVAALRWPCLEAASASAIEAMLAGKPTLVTRAGFYDELPDDCVMKISREDEVEEVRIALHRLVEDASIGAAIGVRARDYASAMFRAEPYAEQLVTLARHALTVAAPLAVIDDIVRTLGEWDAGRELGEPFIFDPLQALWRNQATSEFRTTSTSGASRQPH
jgi:glycosyltransferase involved in cell wall biosynthesis